jgi:hypothetical protein
MARGGRTVWLPGERDAPRFAEANLQEWLRRSFNVAHLVEGFPGTQAAISRHSPIDGQFAKDGYPAMYEGLRTAFDDTIALVADGVLHEKILLEYKTAKSTKGKGQTVEGNVHERLSYQIMQYLEAATQFTRCSLLVLANGAFAKYRNKYHVGFRVQADRLASFCWFSMQHACTAHECLRFAEGIINWLITERERHRGHLR